MMEGKEGWVYVFTNEAMPGLVKIGYSMKDPSIRAEELYRDSRMGAVTGVPLPFTVEYKALVVSPHAIEQHVHKELENQRLNPEREFFRCEPFEVIKLIRKLFEIKYEELLKYTHSELEGTYSEKLPGRSQSNCENSKISTFKRLILRLSLRDIHKRRILQEIKDSRKVLSDREIENALREHSWQSNDDEWYFGDMLEYVRHGQGLQVWPDNRKYIGCWRKGERVGQGTLIQSEGQLYSGEWYRDKPHGKGTYTELNGDFKYVGDWENGRRHGAGTQKWPEGHRYVGQWANDQRRGYGKCTWRDGATYEGEWLDDKPHGQGVQILPDGSKYEGDFINGDRAGEGVLTWRSGMKYDGEFSEGKRHGAGTQNWPNTGNCHGKIQSGIWKNDEFIG